MIVKAEVIVEGYLISKETKKENLTFLYFASRRTCWIFRRPNCCSWRFKQNFSAACWCSREKRLTSETEHFS